MQDWDLVNALLVDAVAGMRSQAAAVAAAISAAGGAAAADLATLVESMRPAGESGRQREREPGPGPAGATRRLRHPQGRP